MGGGGGEDAALGQCAVQAAGEPGRAGGTLRRLRAVSTPPTLPLVRPPLPTHSAVTRPPSPLTKGLQVTPVQTHSGSQLPAAQGAQPTRPREAATAGQFSTDALNASRRASAKMRKGTPHRCVRVTHPCVPVLRKWGARHRPSRDNRSNG